jgi:hypothetical protein
MATPTENLADQMDQSRHSRQSRQGVLESRPRLRRLYLRVSAMVGAPVLLISALAITSSPPSASAQNLVSSNLCPGKQKVALGASSAWEVSPAWQPASHLLDNQQAAENNTRPWEFSIWSPGFPGNAQVGIGFGGQVELDGVVLVSPTFGDAGGSLGIVVNGVSKQADVGPVGQAKFTAITGRADQIRVTRSSSASANVAELIVCGRLVGGPDTTTTTTVVTNPGNNCTVNVDPSGAPGSAVKVCLPFASGNREYTVRALEASYGTNPPPAQLKGPGWEPTLAGECSAAEHDKYWVRAADNNYYRTWHPASIGSCTFGHEHGDDPRTSNLNVWSGGVPFAYANELNGAEREEDHVGHKITVQNSWEAVTANGADSRETATSAGFTCHWLSHIHQGTHSPDALGENAHEYHVNVACDDGAARKPTNPQWEAAAGANNHTEVSLKLLAAFGEPGSFKACAGKEFVIPNGVGGGLSSLGNDTHRVLPCVDGIRRLATALGPNAAESRDDGTEELWRPGGILKNNSGNVAVKVNAYYQVWDPIRVYNRDNQSFDIDRDGNGQPDQLIYTIDMCTTQKGRDFLIAKFANFCDGLPAQLNSVPKSEWWKSPLSPFRGMKRSVHSKGVTLDNGGGPEFRCTSATGRDGYADAIKGSDGVWTCPNPASQILQRTAKTDNLWNYPDRATWGPSNARGNIQGSAVNRRSDGKAAGYGFEWVKFYNDLDNAGIHAPN